MLLGAALFVDLEVGEGEGGGFAVAPGDFVDDADGVGVTAAAHEVFGGFEDREDDEAEEEHYHGQQTHADHEPPPSEILAFRAACCVCLTGMVA